MTLLGAVTQVCPGPECAREAGCNWVSGLFIRKNQIGRFPTCHTITHGGLERKYGLSFPQTQSWSLVWILGITELGANKTFYYAL